LPGFDMRRILDFATLFILEHTGAFRVSCPEWGRMADRIKQDTELLNWSILSTCT